MPAPSAGIKLPSLLVYADPPRRTTGEATWHLGSSSGDRIMRRSTMRWSAALVLALVVPSGAEAQDKPTITLHRTPAGVRFGLLGAKGKSPAPTLFVFATGAEESLRSADFNK